MSLTSVSSISADCCAPSTSCRWSAFSSLSARMLVSPTTPLSGVRISWLMFARNSDIIAEDCSAC